MQKRSSGQLGCVGLTRIIVILLAGLLAAGLGGCPPANDGSTDSTSGGDTGSATGGGDTGGADTGSGATGGGDTGGAGTDGGDTGGDTGGGIEDGGGATGGGDTGGADTDGGDTGGSGDATGGSGSTGGGDTGGSGDTTGGDTGGSGDTDGGDDVSGGDTTPPPTSITFQKIVQTGGAVPGQSGAQFTQLGSPIIDADGRVAFWALYSGGSGNGGLYIWDSGTLSRVVDDDPAGAGSVPGGTASEYFGIYTASGDYDPLEEPLTWGSAGRLLFTSRISGGQGRTALFRWRAIPGTGDPLIQVADTPMIQEGLGLAVPGSIFISYFANFGVTDNGIVLFRTRYTRLNPTATGNAVCTSNGLEVTPVAVPTDAAPDQTSAFFNDFKEETTLSPGGRMLFQGAYAGGTGTHGVYLSNSGGSPARVVDNRPSSSFPGLPASARIGTEGQYYAAIAIGANDHIAVQTPITVAGSTRDAVILWDWDLGKWTELTVAGGTPASALLSGVSDGGAVVALAGGTPHVVDRSSSVSIAATLPAELAGVNLTWATSGGAINNDGHAIVPYTRTDAAGTPGLGFWTNDELLILADPAAALPSADVTAITANSLPENDRPGRSGVLNDGDEAVFRVTTSGGGQALYVGRAQ